MAHDPDCPLCRTVAELSVPTTGNVVWQFPQSVAYVGPWQFYSGYCLLASRQHATELSQLGPHRSAFLEEMALLAEAMESCFRPYKLNYELLGNVVPHLHWHIFPRYADDPERLQPVWLALERAKTDAAEKRRLESGRIPAEEVCRRLQTWLSTHNAPRL